jgi:hypothetical protein
MWVVPPPPVLECSVCSEVFADPVTLACGHTFCRACAVRWFTNSAKRCPVCRGPDTAGSNPATLSTAITVKGMVEELRVYCRFGMREDERGAWVPDPDGCPLQLSRGDAAAHEAACEHALEACPFAGCGVLRRRRDAEAHDAAAVVAHLGGERDARLALEASSRAQQARLDALEARLAAVVPAAAGGSGAARAVTGAALRATLNAQDSPVYTCDWSPDGRTLVSGNSDGTLKLWDGATLQCAATLNGHESSVTDCVFSPDGRTVASASSDKTLKLWDVATRTCSATLEHDDFVFSCTWSPDGRSLASTTSGCFKVWDVATRSCTATLDGEYASCAWGSDGRTVLIGGDDGTVMLWDVATRSCVATLDGHTSQVCACTWSPDGRRFVTASFDKTLKLWSAAAPFTCTATLEGHTHWVNSGVWSPDGLTVASTSHDQTVRLWNAATGNCLATLECDSGTMNCCWSPDSNMLAVACADGSLVLFDVQRA